MPQLDKFTSKFMSEVFSSVRDDLKTGYVAEIRKQDPKKCWPFGSLGDPYNNEFFNSYDFTESNMGIINIQDDQPNSTTSVGNEMVKDSYNGSSGLTFNGLHNGHENSVNEGPKNGKSAAVDNKKPGTNRPKIKHQRTRLLIDLHNDPACNVLRAPRDETNPVNKKFVAETEDELSDDVTFDENFGKRKGVEVTNLKIKKKKRSVRYEQPKVDQGKKSKRGFKETIGEDFEAGEKQNAIRQKKLPCNQKRNRIQATKSTIEDSEIEVAAFMLTCLRKEADISVCENMLRSIKINADRTFVQPKFQKRSKKVQKRLHKKFTNEKAVKKYDDRLKGATDVGPVRDAKKLGTLVCSVNMNPADFGFPEDDNEFIRD